ncbi:hypothetical protein [Halorubrum sp. CBA1125]|nr:hypothetical protein [Halorubrum sp. CBA1125]
MAGILVVTGAVVFTANMLQVIRRHSPHSMDHVVLGALNSRRAVE